MSQSYGMNGVQESRTQVPRILRLCTMLRVVSDKPIKYAYLERNPFISIWQLRYSSISENAPGDRHHSVLSEKHHYYCEQTNNLEVSHHRDGMYVEDTSIQKSVSFFFYRLHSKLHLRQRLMNEAFINDGTRQYYGRLVTWLWTMN